MFYAPGEKMTFELRLTDAANLPEDVWFIKWTRTGDDGKREEGKAPASAAKPLVLATSLDKPGFVRIYAELVDKNGKVYRKDAAKYKNETGPIFFDGGAGVQPEKFQGLPEPADSDAFWGEAEGASCGDADDDRSLGTRLPRQTQRKHALWMADYTKVLA